MLKDTNGTVFRRGFDGTAAWEVSNWGGPNVDPTMVLLTRVFIDLYRGDTLPAGLPNLSLKGTEPIGSGQAYVIEVGLPGQSARLWFDATTWLLVRIESSIGSAVLQPDWGDYRDIGGLWVPFKWREAGTENWVVECSEVKRNEPIVDEASQLFIRGSGRRTRNPLPRIQRNACGPQLHTQRPAVARRSSLRAGAEEGNQREANRRRPA